MIDFPTIAIMYKLEAMAEYNPFTKEQRDNLVAIMDKVEVLPTGTKGSIYTIKKYKSLEKEYITKFNSWGGNGDELNKKLIAFEDSHFIIIKQFKEKFKALKVRMGLK